MKDTVTIGIERFKELERKEQELKEWQGKNNYLRIENVTYSRPGSLFTKDYKVFDITTDLPEIKAFVSNIVEDVRKDIRVCESLTHQSYLYSKIPNWIKNIFK